MSREIQSHFLPVDGKLAALIGLVRRSLSALEIKARGGSNAFTKAGAIRRARAATDLRIALAALED